MQGLLNFHARVNLRQELLHHKQVVCGVIDYQGFDGLSHLNFLGPRNLGLVWCCLTKSDTIQPPIFKLFPLNYRWSRNIDSADVGVEAFVKGFQLRELLEDIAIGIKRILGDLPGGLRL
jgi:hypothetical protein